MGATFCSWHGISCDANGNVVSIDLSGNGLIGTISSAIFTGLSQLLELNLANNKGLTGPLPPEIGQASNICLLELYGCSLNGNLPDVFDRLTHFDSKYCQQPKIDLHFNKITGELPKSIGEMGALPYISVANNKHVGPIPTSWYLHLRALIVAPCFR